MIIGPPPKFHELGDILIVLPWGPWWVRWGLVGVFTAVIAAGMIILPEIRHRVFWYAISSTEIDIQSGIIFLKRSIVPMHRVQTLRSECDRSAITTE